MNNKTHTFESWYKQFVVLAHEKFGMLDPILLDEEHFKTYYNGGFTPQMALILEYEE